MVYQPDFILNHLSLFINKNNNLIKFLRKYDEIIKLDKKKPLFSLTDRYNTFPKQHKFERLPDKNFLKKGDHAWCPTTNNNNMVKIIKGILNKITDKNYKELSNELLLNLLKFNMYDMFDVLIKEILEKCIYDNKYHYIYINLCKMIWNNKEIYYNITTISKLDDKYYWNKNVEIKNTKLYGAFNSIEDVKKNIIETLNFKDNLINYFCKEYTIKNILFNEIIQNKLDDEEIFKRKKKIQSIFEFIVKLYFKKYTTVSKIDYLFTYLIENKIYKEDIECIYHISKLLNKNNYNNLEIFIQKFEMKIKDTVWDDRITFFIKEIIGKKTYSNNILPDILQNKSHEYYINKYINRKITIDDLCEKIKIKGEVSTCDIIVDSLFEDFKNLNKYVMIITTLYKKRYMFRKEIITTLNIILKNYSDLLIDIPNLSYYYSLLLNNISNQLNITFCNNKFVTNIEIYISDIKTRAKLSVDILNNCKRITDSGFSKLLRYVNKYKQLKTVTNVEYF